jgi:hypothetical protein
MKAQGRPTKHSAGLASHICALLAEGKSLREICRDENMPAESTVRLWVVDDRDGFSAQYARAREAQADYWAEQIVEIADDGSNDTYTDKDGNERTDQEVIARSRLRVDTRKWLMARMAPKRYGDKITQEVTGADGAPLVPIINLTGRPEPSSSS